MRLYWIYALFEFFAAPRSADVACEQWFVVCQYRAEEVEFWVSTELVETHICVSGRALNYHFGLYLRVLLTPRIGALGT